MQEHTLEKIKKLNKELAEDTGFAKFNKLQEALGHYINCVEDEFKRLKESRNNWKKKYMECKK